MEHFLTNLRDILEVDELRPSDVLQHFPEWDSLSVLSSISMIFSDYGVTLSAAELRRISTAEDLYRLVEAKRAN